MSLLHNAGVWCASKMVKSSPRDISLRINRLIISWQARAGSERENFYLTREFYTLCISWPLNT